MTARQEKVDALTTLVNDGALGEALTFAVLNKFPESWVNRVFTLYMERLQPILEAAAVPIPDSEDVAKMERLRIYNEMKAEKEDRNQMTQKDARQAASNFIRAKNYKAAHELALKFGGDVITKNYRRDTSKYMQWVKRQRLGIIGQYRNMVIVDFEAANEFRRKHNIQESELNPTFK